MDLASKKSLCPRHAWLLCALAGAAPASAQMAPPRSHEVAWKSDSGLIALPPDGARVVYSTVVFVPRASWLRLRFGGLGSGDTFTRELE